MQGCCTAARPLVGRDSLIARIWQEELDNIRGVYGESITSICPTIAWFWSSLQSVKRGEPNSAPKILSLVALTRKNPRILGCFRMFQEGREFLSFTFCQVGLPDCIGNSNFNDSIRFSQMWTEFRGVSFCMARCGRPWPRKPAGKAPAPRQGSEFVSPHKASAVLDPIFSPSSAHLQLVFNSWTHPDLIII